ncbi:MAG TPA: RluA family pseudouridine synthase [Polyangia bacterium]|jgi:23S rRNA pseudouridine1911/1915/1917 synthase
MRRISLSVSDADEGERLDRFIAARGGVSRGLARRALERGGVFLDGHRCKIAARALRPGQSVVVNVEEEPGPPPVPLGRERLLLRDHVFVAIDKPTGVPAQATRATDRGTVAELVAALIGAPVTVIHRLDLETSGVMVLGRTKAAAAALSEAFRTSAVEKTYLALCARAPDPPAGRVDAPLGADPARPGARAVRPQGDPAASRYRTLAARAAALVEVQPETGRTHQVRVHLAHLGAPVLGDRRYRGPATVEGLTVPRLMLHAWRLTLPHPTTGERVTIEAPVPADMAALRAALVGA